MSEKSYGRYNSVPYIYVLTHNPTGEYYIGSRSAEWQHCHPDDFMVSYFTSSHHMQHRLVHGDISEWSWKIYPQPDAPKPWRDSVRKIELQIIGECIKDPLCLNTKIRRDFRSHLNHFVRYFETEWCDYCCDEVKKNHRCPNQQEECPGCKKTFYTRGIGTHKRWCKDYIAMGAV